MKIDYTQRALAALEEAPAPVRKAFFTQTQLLAQNLQQHPSLHAKKYNEAEDIWQARVNRNWRFYFSIVGDTYVIRTHHPAPEINYGSPKRLVGTAFGPPALTTLQLNAAGRVDTLPRG